MYLDCHTHRNFNENYSIVNLRGSNSKSSSFFYSFGFHPWEVELCQQSWTDLELNLQDNKCLALGEVGLDKLKGPLLEIQISRLNKQLEINESLIFL